MSRIGLIFVSFLGNFAFCTQVEIMWTKFEVNRTYEDTTTRCFGLAAKGQILFSGEVQDGVVIHAQMQNYLNKFPYDAIHSSISLSPREAEAIRLYRDNRGSLWIKHLTLSESATRWAFYESGKHYSHCPLPQPLKSVAPSSISFEFETEGLEDGIWVSESNKLSVSGNRSDGHPFTGTIQFTQREYFDEK